MALSKDDILNAIADMSVMEVVDLVRSMEEKFGVSAAAPMAVAPPGAGASDEAAAAVEEQTEFTVVLASAGDKKVNVIKAVRSITGLGLKEAKALVGRSSFADQGRYRQGGIGGDKEAVGRRGRVRGSEVEHGPGD